MRIINLTPHDIVVQKKNCERVTFEKSGVIARISSTTEVVGEIDGIVISQTSLGEVQYSAPLPEADYYIVSGLVKAASSRSDFLQPDTSPNGSIRDDSGRIVAVKGFIK